MRSNNYTSTTVKNVKKTRGRKKSAAKESVNPKEKTGFDSSCLYSCPCWLGDSCPYANHLTPTNESTHK